MPRPEKGGPSSQLDSILSEDSGLRVGGTSLSTIRRLARSLVVGVFPPPYSYLCLSLVLPLPVLLMVSSF